MKKVLILTMASFLALGSFAQSKMNDNKMDKMSSKKMDKMEKSKMDKMEPKMSNVTVKTGEGKMMQQKNGGLVNRNGKMSKMKKMDKMKGKSE